METVNQDHHKVNPICSSPLAPAAGGGNGDDTHARITCVSKVANNLDFLKINFHVGWADSDFFDLLEVAKKQAQNEEKESQPVDLAGTSWNCMRAGTGYFPYRLRRGDITLLINRRSGGDISPNFRLEIGSLSCWAQGINTVYSEIKKIIFLCGGHIAKEQISEFHLAADFIGIPISSIPLHFQENWISRNKKFTVNYDNKKLTGITLGKGNLMLRVYDKVAELKRSPHKQDIFEAAWRVSSYDATEGVTRVEYQLRRPALRHFQPKINTIEELTDSLTSIWGYCTRAWSRLVAQSVDRNHHQSRSENHSFWSHVQELAWSGCVNIRRHYPSYPCKDVQRLRNNAVGYAMSIAAQDVRDPNNIDLIIANAQGYLENDIRVRFHSNPDEFVSRMQRKINDIKGLSIPLENDEYN